MKCDIFVFNETPLEIPGDTYLKQILQIVIKIVTNYQVQILLNSIKEIIYLLHT